MNRKLTLIMLVFISVVISNAVLAEARRDTGGADPLRKAQYIIRQLSQEKSRLEADNAKLNADLKTQSDKVEELERKLDKANKNNDKLVNRVKADNQRMKSLLEKYKDTVTTLRSAKKDNRLLVNAVEERNQWMDVCRQKNIKMSEVNVELLERYRRKDFSDFLAEKEPLTGMAKVELENEEQEYRFRLEDLEVTQFRTSVE